jgi:hypothetical protein
VQMGVLLTVVADQPQLQRAAAWVCKYACCDCGCVENSRWWARQVLLGCPHESRFSKIVNRITAPLPTVTQPCWLTMTLACLIGHLQTGMPFRVTGLLSDVVVALHLRACQLKRLLSKN